MKILETKRTYLREMTTADAENAYLLNLDPEVVKYTGDTAFASIEEAKQFLENYDHYKKYGFGRWAVIDKATHTYLGWCGLKFTKELDEYDIGFRFARPFWNQGYATETAQACLDYGFTILNLPEIVGRARKDNIGSVKVLEKLGLVFASHYDFEGYKGVLYKLKNPNTF